MLFCLGIKLDVHGASRVSLISQSIFLDESVFNKPLSTHLCRLFPAQQFLELILVD